MAALTAAYEAFQKPTLIVSYQVAASTTIYKGGLVALNSSGFVVPISHATADLRFVGIAEETVVNDGANGDKNVRIAKSGGGVYADISSATQADIGKEAYAATDNEIRVDTTGLTNQYKVGTVVALEKTSVGSDGLRIRIDNYSV